MTDTPPEQMPMEKPKPARKWRSFGKEYVIVVLGVATALAAQQGADWLRWEGEVTAARTALRAEMTINNTRFYDHRVAIAPCLERQAKEAQAIIAALEAGRKVEPLAGFRAGLRSQLSDAEWQSQRSAEVLTHFPRNELELMNSYYAPLPSYGEWMTREETAWQELSILQDIPTGISTSDIIRLRVNLAIAQRQGFLIERIARRQLGVSEQLGFPRVQRDTRMMEAFCSRMSLEAWMRWQNENRP